MPLQNIIGTMLIKETYTAGKKQKTTRLLQDAGIAGHDDMPRCGSVRQHMLVVTKTWWHTGSTQAGSMEGE